MTDLDIIKHIEQEFNLKFEKLTSEQNRYTWNYYEKSEIVEKHPVSYYSRKPYSSTQEEDNEVVKTLIISDCKLSKIPELIYSLKKLETLVLSNNEIKEVSGAIVNLKELWHIDLSNNKIEKIPKSLFEASKFLTTSMGGRDYHFDFSNNKIERIPENKESFTAVVNELTKENAVGLPNIPSINLVGNNIKYPPLQMFKEKNLAWQEYYDLQKKHRTKDIYFNNEKRKSLPYCIKSIKVNNYHELKNVSIQNIETDTQWIFVTGENGYGKTSLLQSIVIGFLGNEDEKNILNKEGEIILEYKNQQENIVNITNNEFDYADDFPHFAAYGPARLVKNSRYVNQSKTASLFNPYSELFDIEDKLKIWKNEPAYKHLYNGAIEILIKLLSPQIKNIETIAHENDIIVRYIEKDTSEAKSFNELASGYRSIITMVGDIIIRLSKYQSEIKDFSELAGIVLIDEIDLHLHPKWQKAMVENLTNLFPKIQFIASTHSPIPILGAPENTVIINVQRTEKGITAKKLEFEFKTLLPNTLLSSPIFGFEEYLPKSIKDLSKLRTEDGWNEILFNDEVERRINKMIEEGKND